MNKYLKVSLTLATIASGSALLIGLMNLATINAIKTNKENKIKNGISKLYPSLSSYVAHDFLTKDDENYDMQYDADIYPHLKSVYVLTYGDNQDTGYVYSTTGKNAYGQVDLLISVNDYKVDEIYVVTNTESYGPTLEDNYINKYNNGYVTLRDVRCGATYGAKTVEEECDDALRHWINFFAEKEAN